jgi:hypothetical protein
MPEASAIQHRTGYVKVILFTLFTLFAGFILVEGVWRLVYLAGLSIPPSGDRNLDREWEWVVTTHKKGRHPISEGPFRYDPIMGWGLLPRYAKEHLHINLHGQRGLTDWSIEKDPAKQRILIVGDSYTFGYDVSDNECYSSVLGELLGPQYEVINWGVPGYGTDQQTLLYEEFGAKFAPDVVILGFYTPDLFRNRLWFYNYIKPVFQIQGEELMIANPDIPSPTHLLQMYETGEKTIGPKGSYLRAFLKRELEDLRRDRVNKETLEWPVTRMILERFNVKVRENGAKPLLLIIPDKDVLKKEESASTDTAGLLREKAAELGMPCLDMIPVLREKARIEKEPLYKGHWTPLGHRVCAEALAKVLSEQGLAE